MPLSHFARIFSWPDAPDLRLVYSTRTGGTALVPHEVLEAIKTGTVDAESASALSALGLLVDDLKAEKHGVLSLVHQLNSLRTVMKVSVVVNLDCNFRCRYCYEGSRKYTKSFMEEATAAQLVDFIKKRFAPEMTRLTLDFYGGEPLLSVPLIKKISRPLKTFIEDQGSIFEITLVTNGSLLTPKNVAALQSVGLKRAKVTLDGPPDIHNFFRPFRNGLPTFTRIAKNIDACADLIKIAVNGNFTRKNFHEFPRLFDHLTTHGLSPDRIFQLTFAPVLHVSGLHATGFCGGCVSSSEKWLAEASAFLGGKILQHGYRTSASGIAPSLCMVDVNNSFVVHYDGGLYQCVALVGNPDYRSGDIFTGMKDYKKQYYLNHWKNENQCRQCVYLPLCFGGCRFMALQREGHMSRVDCMQEFLDASLESSVKQSLQQQVTVKRGGVVPK